MKGVIFDIKRFSTHDGPGIRTSVFLKGCPLSCVWCQNPEGIDSSIRVWHFPKRCVRCGTCLRVCPEEAVGEKGMDGHFVQIDRHTCTLCGACVESCPSNALSFDGRVVEAGEVVQEILKDKDFYETSGGGMTLMGGDPLYQAEFSRVILTRCGEENIHRAMETALYTQPDILSSFTPLVDLFLVDLKMFDPEKHRRHTGVDNRLILYNFRTLARQLGDPSRLLVRVPLIPGFTADEKNLGEIAGLVRDVDAHIPIELINYNPLAENKYRNMDRDYAVDPETKPFSDREMISLYDIIRNAGATVYYPRSHDRNW